MPSWHIVYARPSSVQIETKGSRLMPSLCCIQFSVTLTLWWYNLNEYPIFSVQRAHLQCITVVHCSLDHLHACRVGGYYS